MWQREEGEVQNGAKVDEGKYIIPYTNISLTIILQLRLLARRRLVAWAKYLEAQSIQLQSWDNSLQRTFWALPW